MIGRNQATLGMVPARQGFEAGDDAGIEADDRLVPGLDLAADEGLAQIGFQRKPGQAVAFQVALVGGDAAGALRLRQFDRHLDPPQKFGGIERLLAAIDRHGAHGKGRMDIEPGNAERSFQRRTHALRHAGETTLGQHGEFVLAQPGQQRRLAELVTQAVGQQGQHQVGALVSQGFVEAAEPVEIGDHKIVIARLRQAQTRRGEKTLAVQQSGQRIDAHVLQRQTVIGGAPARQADITVKINNCSENIVLADLMATQINQAMVLQAYNALHGVLGAAGAGHVDLKRGEDLVETPDLAIGQGRLEIVEKDPVPQGRKAEDLQVTFEFEAPRREVVSPQQGVRGLQRAHLDARRLQALARIRLFLGRYQEVVAGPALLAGLGVATDLPAKEVPFRHAAS